MSYVVCVSRPSRNRMCNGSGTEQDWTGINWLKKLYPVEESHEGDSGSSFFCFRLGV